MKLPWRTRVRLPAPPPENPLEDPAPLKETYSSPGLEKIVADFSGDGGVRVLDLGPTVPENVAFLARFASEIQIVDAMRESVEADRAIRILEGLLPEYPGTIDLVLLWDCLNYLSPDEGRALVAAIAPLCRPEARCLAMVFTSDTMPASPLKYRVVDERHLLYERSTSEETGSPQMPPAAVERVLGEFSLEHAFVLRNGVREFVAIRDAARTKHSG